MVFLSLVNFDRTNFETATTPLKSKVRKFSFKVHFIGPHKIRQNVVKIGG